ncbi:hypothetical protein D3C80_1834790 [compost metagenome]
MYGADWFNNYRKALELLVKNPELSLITAMPYAGGISLSDMCRNDSNPDNNAVSRRFEVGCNDGC